MLRIITRKMTQVNVFTAETWISHSSAFQGLTKDIWNGDVLWTHSAYQSFWNPSGAKGFQGVWAWPGKADMLAEMNFIYLPDLCNVKLENAPGLILA